MKRRRSRAASMCQDGCRKTLVILTSAIFRAISAPIYPSENFCVDCRASYEVAFRESNSQVLRGDFFYSLNTLVNGGPARWLMMARRWRPVRST